MVFFFVFFVVTRFFPFTPWVSILVRYGPSNGPGIIRLYPGVTRTPLSDIAHYWVIRSVSMKISARTRQFLRDRIAGVTGLTAGKKDPSQEIRPNTLIANENLVITSATVYLAHRAARFMDCFARQCRISTSPFSKTIRRYEQAMLGLTVQDFLSAPGLLFTI